MRRGGFFKYLPRSCSQNITLVLTFSSSISLCFTFQPRVNEWKTDISLWHRQSKITTFSCCANFKKIQTSDPGERMALEENRKKNNDSSVCVGKSTQLLLFFHISTSILSLALAFYCDSHSCCRLYFRIFPQSAVTTRHVPGSMITNISRSCRQLARGAGVLVSNLLSN